MGPSICCDFGNLLLPGLAGNLEASQESFHFPARSGGRAGVKPCEAHWAWPAIPHHSEVALGFSSFSGLLWRALHAAFYGQALHAAFYGQALPLHRL